MRLKYIDEDGATLVTGEANTYADIPQAAFAVSQHFGRSVLVIDRDTEERLYRLTTEWLED